MTATTIKTRRSPVAVPAGPTPRTSYVGGLDGLRAIAVVAVIFFHADLPWIPGGFLGVDVFFVISGYLITSQLWVRGIRDGRVGLRRFWLGRARRLLPALACLLTVTTALSALFDRPALHSYLGDLLAASTYTSNWWYVVHQRSYFEAMGRPPALQHLWSLAVEEQFYLLWPLVVTAVLLSTRSLARRQHRLLMVCLVLAFASALWMGFGTAAAQAPVPTDPSRFYFGTDAHASGLLFGAAFAVLRRGQGFDPELPSPRSVGPRATLAGVLGLGLVFACFLGVNSWSTWFYRVGFLLFPLVMVVVIAVAVAPGPLQWFLDQQPLAYLGKRSYGLYLWHWPIVVFTRPGLDVPLDPVLDLVLRLTLTLACAEASYRFVETPIRRYGFRRAWRRLRGIYVGRYPATRVLAGVLATVTVVTAGSALTAGPAHGGAIAPAATPSVSVPAQPAATAVAPPPVSSPSAPATPHVHTNVPADMHVTAYGDSVVLGAQSGLDGAFGQVKVVAMVGEQAAPLLDQLSTDAPSLKDQDAVVLHTGNNGIVSRSQLDATLAAIPDGVTIVLVLPRVPRPWQEPNLATLKAAAQADARVHVVDWYGASADHPEYFEDDGVHLKAAGIAAYTKLVVDAASHP